MPSTIEFNADLIRRYDQTGPRYTSYPVAVHFNESFDRHAYRNHLERSNQELIPRPLSLYFHIPFCSTLCFYCACNKIVTKNKSHCLPYLEHLFHEIELQSAIVDPDRQVEQIHLGGGTPTFLDINQLTTLLDKVSSHFSIAEGSTRDFSIEIDPRSVSVETARQLIDIGFNRVSMGVQDFNAEVQKAVHRIQAESETLEIIQALKESGVSSTNIDLMYGLPKQTHASFRNTIEKIIKLDVDRICLFNYAHLPELFKPQRRIRDEDLPSAAEKLKILETSIELLTEAGYIYIGMDHFAKPDDSLSIAMDDGSLRRNFQGFSSHAACDVIAMGITGISQIGDCYGQNLKGLEDYYDCLGRNEIPVFRGIELTADDQLRRAVIERLMCRNRLDKASIEKRFKIDFDVYFRSELQHLKPMQDDGLLSLEAGQIAIEPRGRFLIRNICMVFDWYLQRGTGKTHFSRVI